MTFSKKICFISAGLAGGGMERALTSLANHYSLTGHKVSIINLFQTEQFYDLDKNIQIIWPTIERSKYHRLVYAFAIIPYLRNSIKNIQPDLMISFGEWFNPYVILTTRFLNIPLFISDRMGPNMSIGPLLETSRKLLYRFADGIIAQTSTAAEIIRNKTHARNITVIPNPVKSIEADTSIKKNQIVTVGRLSREKGHIILVKAFGRINQQGWTLQIIGDGPERSAITKEIIELGLEDRIYLHGHLKNFGQILGESLIFVLPSFYEGFPNALVEAMSVPLACISSDCVAGPRDIIKNNENGILVPPGDIDTLAKEMSRLIHDEALRLELTDNAMKVREKYKFEVVAAQYLAFMLSNTNLKYNNR